MLTVLTTEVFTGWLCAPGSCEVRGECESVRRCDEDGVQGAKLFFVGEDDGGLR